MEFLHSLVCSHHVASYFLAKTRVSRPPQRVLMRRTAPSSEPPSKRPARGQLCAASIAGFEPDDTYNRAVKIVSACVVSSAVYQPPEPVACSAVQR